MHLVTLGEVCSLRYVCGVMSVSASVKLTREVTAVAIPAGTPHPLPADTEVFITQELGGTFTVHAQGSLFRIDGKDADALGREATATPSQEDLSDTTLEDETLWDTLKTCFDPEIPVNIVDLGLIYDMTKEAQADGRFRVSVKMTLTAPGCGMGDVIANDARQKLLALPAVDDAIVEIVWDPPWHQSMITEQGRLALGLE